MSSPASMAVLTLERKLDLGASDLRFLLTNHGIKDDHQGALFEAGVDTMAKFAAFVTTAADLVEVLKKEFSLDPATSLANRAQVASYTVAWQSAQARAKQQAEVEATSETREWAKPIPTSDYIAMRQRFAKAFGEPEDRRIPAKEYIEKKLAELEAGAISLDWERPFLGPLYAWSSAIQGRQGPMTIPAMLRIIFSWLADRLEGGDRLQRPSSPPPITMACPSLRMPRLKMVGHGWGASWRSSWAPWAFSKSSPNKVIAALELLATLIAVKLWVRDSDERQSSSVATRGFTDNQSNEALVKKAMTSKYPSSLILLELAEELAAKKCDLNLIWIRRDWNQLADDLTNEKFDSFDPEFRVPVKGDEIEWRVLDKLLNCADSFYGELKKRKAAPIGPVRKAGKIRKLSPW